MVAALGMLSSTWARADTVPGHYTITLSDWDDNQYFDFIPYSDPNPNDAFDTSDFTDPDDFCPGFTLCVDPSVGLGGGGKSQAEDGEFTFTTGDDAGTTIVLDYQNSGAPIEEVLLELTDQYGNPIGLPANQDGELFTCTGDDLFTNCGFYVNSNGDFEVAFWNALDSPSGIPTAVPEPSQWIMLLLPLAAMIVARVRKQSAS
jgi:hypothetical protein